MNRSPYGGRYSCYSRDIEWLFYVCFTFLFVCVSHEWDIIVQRFSFCVLALCRDVIDSVCLCDLREVPRENGPVIQTIFL